METWTTADGLRLHLQHWPAGQAAPARSQAAADAADHARGTLLLVHGLGEHVGRYDALARAIAAEGWAVWGYDQRGHGRSDGARGAIAGADSLLHDLAGVIDLVRARQQGRVALLGHSMGGLIAARFVAETLAALPAPWSRPVDALVLSSPALDPGMNAVQKLLLAVLGPLAPDLALGNGLKPEWVSRDTAVVRAYVDDPLVHDRITPRLVRFIVDGGAVVRARAAQWRTPTLLLWAGADRCVAPAGSVAFAAAAPPAVVQHQAYAGLYHEIFNEPERAQPIGRLASFLRQI